jgi:hypothetical protein
VPAALIAITLFRENLSFLLGRSPGPKVLGVRGASRRSVEGILDVRELRAEYVRLGVVHAGLHLVVSPDVSVEKAHRMTETVRHRVHKETDGHYCLIQVEPPTRVPAVRLMTNRLNANGYQYHARCQLLILVVAPSGPLAADLIHRNASPHVCAGIGQKGGRMSIRQFA